MVEVCGRCRRIPSPPRLLRTVGRFNDLLMRVIPANLSITYEGMVFLTKGVPTDDSATFAALDVTLRPAAETVADTLRWLLAEGHLKPKDVPRLT